MFERLILAHVPALARLLRQARAVPDHHLDEVVRQLQPRLSPRQTASVIDPAQRDDERDPRRQQQDVEPTARARPQDPGPERQLDRRDQPEQSAAERQRLDGVALEDTPEEVADALVPNLLRLKLERALKQTLLDEPARADGEEPRRPRLDQAQRYRRQEQQHPRREQPAVGAAAERRLPDDPPRKEPQRVLRDVRDEEECEPRREPRLPRAPPEGSGGRVAQAPTLGDPLRPEPLLQDRGPRARAPTLRHAYLFEQPPDLFGQRLLRRAAQRRAQLIRPHAPYGEVGAGERGRT